MAKDAVEVLIEDHRQAKELFGRVLEEEGEREELFTQLAGFLKAHVTVEKEIFYPRIIQKLGADIPREVIEDQRKEETEATRMLQELERMGVEDENFETKLREFRDIVLRHASQVEEGQLFPKVQQKMAKRDLEEMGREMEERKQQILREVRAPAR